MFRFATNFISEIPSPSVGDIGGRSITLNWPNTPPPELQGDIPRNITKYAVTLTPQDGGLPITVFAPAEPGASLEVTGLTPETTYDVDIMTVIDTEGQGEEIYDLKIPTMTVETGKKITTKINKE